MLGGSNYTGTASPPSQGWTDSSLSDLSLNIQYLQVKDEARCLICCDAFPLYRLTRMFGGHILLVYSLLQSSPILGIDEESEGPFAENILSQV